MRKHLRVTAFFLTTIMLLPYSSMLAAEQKKTAPAAPIPAQILSAKKVFIANGGGDESRDDAERFSGGPDRTYNEFYAAMKTWGRYELVTSPADADLVFEIRLDVVHLQRERILGEDDSTYDTRMQLAIRETKTHETLWGITEHANSAVLESNRDKNCMAALTAIIGELKKIAGPAATDPAKS